jgi:hypothetical protein
MKTILALTFIFIGFINAFGQSKTISKDEFFNAFKKWEQQSKEKIYRIRIIKEVQINGNPTNRVEESYSEYVPPDKRRVVYELKTPTFNSKIETILIETILIGEKKYTRRNSGEWREVIVKEKAAPKNDKKITVESDEYKFVGQETINGQNAVLYERVTKHKITLEKNPTESFSTIRTRCWFDKDGLLLKSETETEVVSGITKSLTRGISVYQYDLNIKIEAPTINDVQKISNNSKTR